MAHQPDPHIDRALRIAASDVVYVGDGNWRLSFVNGLTVPAQARLTDGWLDLSAPLPSSWLATRDDLDWLDMNWRLDGAARVARSLRDRSPRLVVDVAIERNQIVGDCVVSACQQMSAALHTIRAAPHEATALGGSTPGTATTELERACRESGWSCVVTDNKVRVDLATRAGTLAATFEASTASADMVVVHLADLSGFTTTSRRAAAALLLAASGSVRAVKGAISRHDDVTNAVLIAPVVASPNSPIDQSIDRALSAVSAAYQLCAREVRALEHERLASTYLNVWNTTEQHNSPMAREENTCLQQR